MKYRIVYVLAISVFLAMPLNFIPKTHADEQNEITLSYKLNFSEPKIGTIEANGTIFTKISMPGCISTGDIGSPSLPVMGTKILLPYGTELRKVNVKGTLKEVNARYDLKEMPVFPYQPPVPIGYESNVSFQMNDEIYASHEAMPSYLYKSLGVDYCRGYAILTLNIYPVKYIPAEGKLYYYDKITINVNVEQTGYVNRFFRNLPEDREYVEKLVMNPEIASTYQARATFEYPGGICDPSEHYDYVIITRQSLANFQATYNWSDLISKRQAMGLDATLVTVEDIISCPDYWNTTDSLFNDTAAKIREFCRDAYTDWGTQYVLIGGDDDGPAVIPRREMDYQYESNVDSDLYWSNLDKTFNDDHDSQWGEAGDSGFDLYSELFIGSITCDEGQDVSNWLTKVFYYEDSFDKDYLENVASYAGNTGWQCEGDDFMDFTLWGTDNWLGPNPNNDGPWPSWLGYLYGYDTWNAENPGAEFNTSQLHTAEPPNPGWMGDGVAGMRDAINNDLCTIIWAVAHANAHMSMDVYDYEWEANYHNTKPFFVHDYGCHCGDMDAADDGVLHAMLFHSDTELAFACVYNTCYGWGNLYSTNSSSALQQKLFVDYMLNTSKSGGPMNWQLGRIQAYTKDTMAPTIDWDYSYGTWRAIIEGCTLFGDPALTLKPPLLPDHNVGVKILDVDDHVIPDEPVYVNATIVNSGQNNESNVYVSFRINGSEVANYTIPFMESQTSYEVSFIWTPSKGWYNVAVNVSIPEDNISFDNEKSKFVVAGADVAVSSISAPSYAIANGTSSITATISNLGKIDEIVTINLKVNGMPIDTVDLFVAGESSQQITLLWSPWAAGNFNVSVEAVIPDDAYLNNNERTEGVQVNQTGGGGADIWVNPLNLYYITWRNTTINDEFTIGNSGDATLNYQLSLPHGFELQWVHSHGSLGHSQLAQPVGDIDEDGVNEFVMGGYGSGGTYIYSYDSSAGTYVQEYFWTYPGGWYNVPSGACVVDLDDDGDLELVVSWEYSGEDGVHAYDWDGSNLTELDWYTGVGYDFAYDIYACDYDDDGDVEVLIANDPGYYGTYHVTALAWNNTTNSFEREISWGSGQSTECPMVWSGDTDGDGKTEVIASAGYNTVYALNYNNGTWTSQIVATGLPAHPYGVACGDLDGDGIDEIGIGLDSTDAYIYKWNSSINSYEQVWHYNFAGEDDIIEGVAIGDADNDGQLEFLVAPSDVHIIEWNGYGYMEKYTLTESDGQIAGLNVGDFDTDGLNEIKACDIITGPGKEWIFDYVPEPTWISLSPKNGSILPGENETVSLSIDTSNLSTGVTPMYIEVSANDADEPFFRMPLYLSIPSFLNFSMEFENGWNFATIPVTTSMPLNASLLYSMIPHCSMILAWNASLQDFIAYAPGSPNDFPIEDGHGYFIAVSSNETKHFVGIPYTTVAVTLLPGWNALGWFKDEPTTARSILENITSCNTVLVWNASSQDFVIYVNGSPYNPAIHQGDGFFVAVTQQSQWHGEG